MEARENNLVWDARRHHNVTMRKGITLAFYLAMIVGGSWAAYDWLVYGGRGIALKLGAFPALFGPICYGLIFCHLIGISHERRRPRRP